MMTVDRRLTFRWLKAHWIDLAAALFLVASWWAILTWRSQSYHRAGGLAATWKDQSGAVRRSGIAPTAELHDAPVWLHEVRWQGWIWVPFDGKFVLGAEALGRAQVTVDGTRVVLAAVHPGHGAGFRHQVVRAWRVIKNQATLRRGWHRLVVVCEPDRGGGCRLLWQPPGRRGSSEYVDPAFLRPTTNRPDESGPSGPPRRDAVAALALLLAFLVTVLLWLRRRLAVWWAQIRGSAQARIDLGAAVALFLFALAIELLVLNSFGQTWDEDAYFGVGRNYWQNLLALDFRPESWLFNFEHPPVTKYLVGFGSLWTEGFLGARLVSAFLSALTAALVYVGGRRLVGRGAAIVGAVLVALSPHLVAHGVIAGHETPTVFFMTLAVVAFILAEERWSAFVGEGFDVDRSPRDPGRVIDGDDARPDRAFGPWIWYMTAGFASGLALSTRWLNGAVLLILGFWWFVGLWPQMQRRGGRVRIHLAALLVPLLALATPFLIWPRLWHAPFYHVGQGLSYYAPGLTTQEMFLGRYRSAPWFYFFVYFTAAVPTILFVGLLADAVRLWWVRTKNELLLIVWWLVPMVAAMAAPLKQDGLRYVIASLVPAGLLAGQGFDWLGSTFGSWMARRTSRLTEHRGKRLGVVLAVVVAMIPSAWSCWTVRPYFLDYYNALWGGPRAACHQKRFEWSWWGEGLTRAAAWLNEHAPSGASVDIQAAARHLVVLRLDLPVVAGAGRADYLLRADSALNRPVPTGFRLVHAERADGCPVVAIYARVGHQKGS